MRAENPSIWFQFLYQQPFIFPLLGGTKISFHYLVYLLSSGLTSTRDHRGRLSGFGVQQLIKIFFNSITRLKKDRYIWNAQWIRAIWSRSTKLMMKRFFIYKRVSVLTASNGNQPLVVFPSTPCFVSLTRVSMLNGRLPEHWMVLASDRDVITGRRIVKFDVSFGIDVVLQITSKNAIV